MRLLALAKSSIPRLFAVVLLLSQYCAAADNEGQADPRGFQDAGGANPVPLQGQRRVPPTLQEVLDSTSQFRIRTHPRLQANEYINWLDLDRINQLPSSYAQHQDTRSDPAVPFYNRRIPLYSTTQNSAIIEQALRDHRRVGMVDPSRHQAMEIFMDEGHLSQQPFLETSKVIDFFELSPKIHELQKVIYGRHPNSPEPLSIDDVPHFRGIPVLTANHDSLGHMRGASQQNPKIFYLPQVAVDSPERTRYQLINPKTELLTEFSDSQTTEQIKKLLKDYRDYTNEYGRGLASLKFGRPLDRIPELTQFRSTPPSLREYPRFTSRAATREEMIQALRNHGRFRLYLDDAGQPNKVYKVKLQLERPHRGPPRRQLVIKPLTTAEILSEKAFKTFGRLHLPV